MIESFYKFDPFNSTDRSKVIELLKKYFREDFYRELRNDKQLETQAQVDTPTSCESTSNQLLLEKITELKQKLETVTKESEESSTEIASLTEELNRQKEINAKSSSKHEEKMKAKQDECQRLYKRITELEGQLKEANKRYKEDMETAQALHEDEKKNLEDKISEKDNAYLTLQRNSINNERELKKEIERLNSTLSEYKPDLGAEVGEEKLYKIDERRSIPTLIVTNSDDAPYIVQIAENGKALFRFNVDKGPSSSACANIEKMLSPFCEIEGQVEDANCIINAGDGIAEISPLANKEISKIIKKAKISLVRK